MIYRSYGGTNPYWDKLLQYVVKVDEINDEWLESSSGGPTLGNHVFQNRGFGLVIKTYYVLELATILSLELSVHL